MVHADAAMTNYTSGNSCLGSFSSSETRVLCNQLLQLTIWESDSGFRGFQQSKRYVTEGIACLQRVSRFAL